MISPLLYTGVDFFGTLETLPYSLDDAFVSGRRLSKTSAAISVSATSTATVSTDITAVHTGAARVRNTRNTPASLDDVYCFRFRQNTSMQGSVSTSSTSTASALRQRVAAAAASVAATAAGTADRSAQQRDRPAAVTSSLTAFRERLASGNATAAFTGVATGVFEVVATGVATVVAAATGLASSVCVICSASGDRTTQ